MFQLNLLVMRYEKLKVKKHKMKGKKPQNFKAKKSIKDYYSSVFTCICHKAIKELCHIRNIERFNEMQRFYGVLTEHYTQKVAKSDFCWLPYLF